MEPLIPEKPLKQKNIPGIVLFPERILHNQKKSIPHRNSLFFKNQKKKEKFTEVRMTSALHQR